MKSDRRQRAAWMGLIIWSSLLTLMTYGSALQLPFFFDDFVHLPFVDAHSPLEMWQTASGLGYYRPLAFTIWKWMFLALGQHSPFAQHALNLILHTVNGLMVAWLAARVYARQHSWPMRYLSATLFLLFPFSYQAVPWVGSMAHLLVTALILASLTAYARYRLSGRRAWAAISLAAALLAPFAHENGVLVGPLVALVELAGTPPSQSARRALQRFAVWAVPALLWLPIWWLAPKGVDVGALALNGGEALLQNSAYFVQGLAYPLTWLGGWLRDTGGANDMAAALGLSAIALVAAALVQRRSGAGRRAWLPWLWYALASAPAVALLEFDYVINGPRLLMLASVGAAWLWANVVLHLIDWSQSKIAAGVLGAVPAAGLCIILLLQNYSFIRDRMIFHNIGGSAIRQATTATVAANEIGEHAIFINLPAWLAPRESTYALGHEGVQFLPGYAPPEAIAAVNAGRPARLSVARNEDIRPEMPYLYGLRGSAADWAHLQEEGGLVFVSRYSPDGVRIEQAGALDAPTHTANGLASFEDTVVLLDASAQAGERGLTITLAWLVRKPPPPHVTVFVHLVDEDGQLISQADGDPLAGSYPFFLWPADSVSSDIRFIDESGSGRSIRIGLYDRLTGNRLTTSTAGGSHLPDDALSINVQTE